MEPLYSVVALESERRNKMGNNQSSFDELTELIHEIAKDINEKQNVQQHQQQRPSISQRRAFTEQRPSERGGLAQQFLGKTNFCWNRENISGALTVVDDLTVSKTRNRLSTDIAKAKTGYTDGIHIYKIFWPKANRGEVAVIGLVSSEAPLEAAEILPLCGLNSNSLGWDIVNNKAIYGGNIFNRYPEARGLHYDVPENFFMILDFKKGILSFRDEEGDLGVCLAGIDSVFLKKNISLYPAVNLTKPGDFVSVAELDYSGPEFLKCVLSKQQIQDLADMWLKWRTLGQMIRERNHSEAAEIKRLINHFTTKINNLKDDNWMIIVYTDMIMKDRSITKHIVLYQKYTFAERKLPIAVNNFIEMLKLMGVCTEKISKFAMDLLENKYLDEIGTILDRMIDDNISLEVNRVKIFVPKFYYETSLMFQLKKRILGPTLILLCNLSKLAVVRDAIKKTTIVSFLENYHDNWTEELTVPLLCVMCLGYIKDESSIVNWRINGL